jgi:hypothetical protein
MAEADVKYLGIFLDMPSKFETHQARSLAETLEIS